MTEFTPASGASPANKCGAKPPTQMEKLRALARKMAADTASQYEDARVWKAATGDVIRLLPGLNDEMAWTQFFTHGILENGKWLVTKCPATIQSKCPICELAQRWYDTGYDHMRQKAKRYRRRPNFV